MLSETPNSGLQRLASPGLASDGEKRNVCGRLRGYWRWGWGRLRSLWAARARRKKPPDNAQPSEIVRSDCTATPRSAAANANSILSARRGNAARRANVSRAFLAKLLPIARGRRIPPATRSVMNVSSARLMRIAPGASAAEPTLARASLLVLIPSTVRQAACVIRARTSVWSARAPATATPAPRVRTITASRCAARIKIATPAACCATVRAIPASNASSALIARAPTIAATIAVSTTSARRGKHAAALRGTPSKCARQRATVGSPCSASISKAASSKTARQVVRTGPAYPIQPSAALMAEESSAALPMESRARSSESVKPAKFVPTPPAEPTSAPRIRNFAAPGACINVPRTARTARYSTPAQRAAIVTTALAPA